MWQNAFHQIAEGLLQPWHSTPCSCFSGAEQPTRNHGDRNARPEGGGKDELFLPERPVCDSRTLMPPVVATAQQRRAQSWPGKWDGIRRVTASHQQWNIWSYEGRKWLICKILSCTTFKNGLGEEKRGVSLRWEFIMIMDRDCFQWHGNQSMSDDFVSWTDGEVGPPGGGGGSSSPLVFLCLLILCHQKKYHSVPLKCVIIVY